MARKSRVSLGNVFDVINAGVDSERLRSASVSVLLVVDRDSQMDLALALKKAFVPLQPTTCVRVAPSDELPGDPSAFDAAIVLPGANSARSTSSVTFLVRCGVPVAFVAESSLDAEDFLEGLPQAARPLLSCVFASGPDALLDKLADWLVEVVDEKGIALAAGLAFCRNAEVRRLVSACALENAAVGAVDFIPGADFPVMTVNQARLALNIAAAYGQPIALDRVSDLGAVLGAGFLYRYVARTLVGMVPGIGWALKGGVGYAGTFATGKALALRYDPDARRMASSLADGLSRAREKGVHVASAAAGALTDLSRALGKAPAAPQRPPQRLSLMARGGSGRDGRIDPVHVEFVSPSGRPAAKADDFADADADGESGSSRSTSYVVLERPVPKHFRPGEAHE